MWAVPMVANVAQFSVFKANSLESGKTLNHCDGFFL